MPLTLTEKRIREARRRKGILVPILEETFENMLEVEDEEDEWFMIQLMKARSRPREKGVFSPSMLGSCVRQAYFSKTGKEKFAATSPTTNFYFLDGDFRHYKWQFATWKAHRAGLLELLGCEVRVFHPNGDYAGTIDEIVRVPLYGQEIFPVDFKGMHVTKFQQFEAWGTDENHKVQLVGYGDIINKSCAFESFMGEYLGVEVARCLLIGENKGGPSQRGSSAIALHEDCLEVRKHRVKVKRRLHVLRQYVKNEEIPPPACTSTRTKQFQECPFAPHCREEVKSIQAQKEAEKTEERELSVRRSSRGADQGHRKKSLSSKSEE